MYACMYVPIYARMYVCMTVPTECTLKAQGDRPELPRSLIEPFSRGPKPVCLVLFVRPLKRQLCPQLYPFRQDWKTLNRVSGPHASFIRDGLVCGTRPQPCASLDTPVARSTARHLVSKADRSAHDHMYTESSHIPVLRANRRGCRIPCLRALWAQRNRQMADIRSWFWMHWKGCCKGRTAFL